MRSSYKVLFFAPALFVAAACSKDKPADATLSNDLTLAAQARQTATLDSISAAERARAAAVPAPALRTGSTTPARTTTRRSTSSSGRSTSSSGGTVVASEPRTVTEKNTKRDAAIGAAAGAIIGATTSRDKVKGGLIGAAAGGILGGVIGNNVDIKKKKVP
jgi:uncharacterized protein YcfJ